MTLFTPPCDSCHNSVVWVSESTAFFGSLEGRVIAIASERPKRLEGTTAYDNSSPLAPARQHLTTESPALKSSSALLPYCRRRDAAHSESVCVSLKLLKLISNRIRRAALIAAGGRLLLPICTPLRFVTPRPRMGSRHPNNFEASQASSGPAPAKILLRGDNLVTQTRNASRCDQCFSMRLRRLPLPTRQERYPGGRCRAMKR